MQAQVWLNRANLLGVLAGCDFATTVATASTELDTRKTTTTNLGPLVKGLPMKKPHLVIAGVVVAAALVVFILLQKDGSSECKNSVAEGTTASKGVSRAKEQQRISPFASADGFLPFRFESPTEDAPDYVKLAEGQELRGVDMVLSPGGVEVLGKVLDIGGGSVAGALVYGWGGRAWARESSAFTTANDEGDFRLWLPEGSQRALPNQVAGSNYAAP